MTRAELEHIIRASADVTGQKTFIVIGSQAILGQLPDAPRELLVSDEADLYAPAAPETSDYIDGSLGRDSRFFETHGYHADGVSPATATLPNGWKRRLTPICNANTSGATGWCIDAHDIAVAKYSAGREKDLRYLRDMWLNGILDAHTLDRRLHSTTFKPTDKPLDWIEGVVRRHHGEWQDTLEAGKLESAKHECSPTGQKVRPHTVKIQIASDLHIESWPGPLPGPEVFKPVEDRDLLVLAGDIDVGTRAHAFIKREIEISPVVYVLGNHEHYSVRTHRELVKLWRLTACTLPGLSFLSGDLCEVAGLRIYGCTWYSGLWPATSTHDRATIAARVNDFRMPRDDAGAWTVDHHVKTHRKETAAMRKHAGGVDVVVTHWPPTLDALDPSFTLKKRDRALNPYFVNDAEDLVHEMGAKLWVSGHVHRPHEAKVGETLSVGNPAGYRTEPRRKGFRTGRVVTL